MPMLLMIAMLALAGPQASAPVRQDQSGVIEVTARDSDTKQPISGVRIGLVSQQPKLPNSITFANTNEFGQAVFQGLAVGNYVLSASREGYLNTVSGVQTVAIRPDKLKFEIGLTFKLSAAVTGRVMDSDGSPVVNANVSLTAMTYKDARRILGHANGPGPTDDRGVFRISGISSGEYYVRVEIPFGLEQSGMEVPRVSYYPGVVDPRAAAPLSILGPQEFGGIQITLPKIPVFKISGTLLNPLPGESLLGGRAIDRGTYFLESADPDSLTEPIKVEARITASDDPKKTAFEIAHVMQGSYYLYNFYDTGWDRVPVVVEDHDVEGLLLDLKPAQTMEGGITIIGDRSPIVWDAVRVQLAPKEWFPFRQAWAGGLRISKGVGGGVTGEISVPIPDPKTGKFTITNVPDTRFGISISGLPKDAFISDIRQGGSTIWNDGAIRGSSDGPLEITVDMRGGTVEGRVGNVHGDAVAGAQVTLVPSTMRRENSQLYKRVTSDETGQFMIRGIAPGDYKLFAWSSPPYGHADENAEFIAPYEARGTTIRVDSTDQRTMQLTVIPLP